jgi:hypothetical protein
MNLGIIDNNCVDRMCCCSCAVPLQVIYPWDAVDIWDHTDKAHSPGSATAAMICGHSGGSADSAAATAGDDAAAADAATTSMVC